LSITRYCGYRKQSTVAKPTNANAKPINPLNQPDPQERSAESNSSASLFGIVFAPQSLAWTVIPDAVGLRTCPRENPGSLSRMGQALDGRLPCEAA